VTRSRTSLSLSTCVLLASAVSALVLVGHHLLRRRPRSAWSAQHIVGGRPWRRAPVGVEPRDTDLLWIG
jgi:hypothetical protein